MATEREMMETELAKLLPSSGARAVYLRQDDAKLARTIEKLRGRRDEVRRNGRMASSGFGLAVIERA